LAAEHLLELFHSLLPARQSGHPRGLLSMLSQEARHIGYEDTNVIIANGIGFLSQAYEATAGLIGNTLLALSAHRISRQQVLANFDLLPHIIQEVLRFDPAIQNTRRFVAQSGMVAGHHMHEGETILVVLAAANRDAVANPDPDRFEIHRANRRIFTFGAGDHNCPGKMLAATIARAGIEQLLTSGLDPESLNVPVLYRPSVNTRIPIWGAGERSA
jgi:cytochrome P450